MRYLPTLFLAALITVILCGCSTADISPDPDASLPPETTPTPQPSLAKAVEFLEIQSVSAERPDGTPLSINLYKSTVGETVEVRIEERRSHERANKELFKRVRAAVKVSERGAKLDEDGKKIGERAVVMEEVEGSTETQPTVIWTKGTWLYIVDSNSLQQALMFEKWYTTLL